MMINKDLIEQLTSLYGEAFYLLDSQQFRNNFSEIKDTFSTEYSNFNIAYSYKTNYIPKLCKIVNESGGYAEVVSEMEAELARICGVLPEKIIWNGPIKNPDKLKELLFEGVTVNVDSLREVAFIEKLAKKTDKLLNVGIRCNFDVNDGVVSRFGFDIEEVDFSKALTILTMTQNIHFTGFQCHFAKREIDFWPNRVKKMINLVKKTGIVPERIDIGGGLFGRMPDSLKVQLSSHIPTYKEYAKVVASVFSQEFNDFQKKPELLIEPGSALVGDCMKFVGKVKTIKNVRGKTFATVMGSQKNISMIGVNPPIEIVHMGKEEIEYENLDFVGYTCIENDVLYKNYSGRLALDDVIIINNCGSYSVVMKPPFILPNFPIIDISSDKVELIKRAETFDDIFNTFIM